MITCYGKFCVQEDESDLISRSLRMHGEWAYTEVQLLAPLLHPSDVVWDVGAYLGTFGLGLSQLAHPARLMAVEANLAVIPLLRRNLETNAPCPFGVVHGAVAARAGRVHLVAAPSAENLGATRFEPADETAEDGYVDSLTLQALRAQHGDYDVLKLDIEGMELDALLGDLEYLRNRKPVIWAECNEDPASLQLLAAMKQLGYDPLYVAFPAFRRANFNNSDERIFPIAYEAALLAAPADRLADFSATVTEEECIVRPVATAFDLRRALWDTPRWGQPEWAEMTKPELIARLGRLSRSEDFEIFLSDDLVHSAAIASSSTSLALELTLYWMQSENNAVVGYTEERSARTKYFLNGETQQLKVVFPPPMGRITRLRLDIANASAIIVLHSISLRDADDGEIWRWSGNCDAFSNLGDVICWPGASGEAILFSLSDDPQFDLVVSRELLARVCGGAILQVELTPKPLLKQLSAFFTQIQECTQATLPEVGTDFVPTSLSKQLEELAALLKTQLDCKNETIAAQRLEIESLQKKAGVSSSTYSKC